MLLGLDYGSSVETADEGLEPAAGEIFESMRMLKI